MFKLSKNDSIMNTVNQIYDSNEEDLLGFCISDATFSDDYNDIGRHVIYMFRKNPEHAELLNEMLISVCGWGIESLAYEMEDKREYYDSL